AVAVGGGASFGLTRFSLTELAAAAAAAAGTRRIPGTASGAQAHAARAVFDAAGGDELRYFAPVAATPGVPKALARTVHELRLAGITHGQLLGVARGDDLRETRGGDTLDHAGFPASDIGRLLGRIEAQLDEAMVDDRAALFGRAADACKSGAVRWTGL